MSTNNKLPIQRFAMEMSQCASAQPSALFEEGQHPCNPLSLAVVPRKEHHVLCEQTLALGLASNEEE